MQKSKRKSRAFAKSLATAFIAVSILVPATVAGASGSGFSPAGRELGHNPKHSSHHRNSHRPPSGTVGDPVASGLNAPFGISVDRFGRVYVAEAGIGTDVPAPGQVSRFSHGTKTVLATNAPFVDDVDAGSSGDFAYTVGAPTNLLVRTSHGHTSTTDIGAYEAANNPDQGQSYGPAVDLEALAGAACWATVPPDVQQTASKYTGVVDSDAFRTTRLPDGSRAVADAAGNDILRVDRHGNISTLAVLPPIDGHLTKAFLSGPLTDAGNGFPQCVLDAIPADGIDFVAEPVPTGIQMGPDGYLYVGLLPGAELPGGAKVVRINLHTKHIEDFVGGFSDVTDIAFGAHNTLYLTELFTGDVIQVPTHWSHHHHGLEAGTPSVLAAVPLPNGLAVGPHGTVYVSINSLTPDGAVVPITP